jgi:hypothetical protein
MEKASSIFKEEAFSIICLVLIKVDYKVNEDGR